MSALDNQVSGTHYKDKGIQPIVYIHANNLGFCEGNAVKYLTRHREKGGADDIRKAIHYLELLLELEYADTSVGLRQMSPDAARSALQKLQEMGGSS